MASLNPSSDISSYINTIWEASILVARDNNVMSGLVRTFNDRTGVAGRQNSQYSGVTVNSVTETTDLVGQAFTPASIATLTPSEVGAQYFLTDTRVESDPFAVRNDASADLGGAMATKIETDLISSFSSFTGGTVGTAGSVITWDKFFGAEAILRQQKAPYPYYCAMSPYQWYVLAKSASVAGTRTNASNDLLDEINSNFFVRAVGGVLVFVSANITSDANDDATGGMWSRDALALDMRRAPRIEAERDASRRGWELNLSSVYAYGVWRPRFGVKMIFDNAVPA